MPQIRATTTDYTGRQMDIELLQSIEKPAELIRVSISSVSKPAKAVAGIEKAVQRYASALLSYLGTVHFDQAYGTNLVKSLLAGNVQDLGQLRGAFSSANSLALLQLRQDDDQTGIFGTQPDDERITAATLLSHNIDYNSLTIYLRVLIVTAAGDKFEFVIPTTTPR